MLGFSCKSVCHFKNFHHICNDYHTKRRIVSLLFPAGIFCVYKGNNIFRFRTPVWSVNAP